MVTAAQQQAIVEFCRERHIIRFWLLDEPLINERIGKGCPSAIVTFHPYFTPIRAGFTRMEQELATIIGSETALYATSGLSPRLTEKALTKANLVFPNPSAPPATPETVARFCREHHITKLWLLDESIDIQEEFSPSVIVNFHPDYTPGMEFFEIQDELGILFTPGTTLYTADSLSPGEAERALNTAEVWYADTAG